MGCGNQGSYRHLLCRSWAFERRREAPDELRELGELVNNRYSQGSRFQSDSKEGTERRDERQPHDRERLSPDASVEIP
jgi:hypothetical protein